MKYAVIENGVVINIVVAEPDFAAQMGWVVIPEYVDNKAVGKDWGYDGANWIAPIEPIVPEPEPAPTVTVDVERI
jgi:hypothetical protein